MLKCVPIDHFSVAQLRLDIIDESVLAFILEWKSGELTPHSPIL
jgi:hypothetical protein